MATGPDAVADQLSQLNTGDATPSSANDILSQTLDQVQVTLANKQEDPNSPLYSAKSFEELKLSPELLKGVYKMGFIKPSKIQERALPLLLQDPPKNMVGQSQSGTGKTAAFVLTMLTRVDPSIKATQAVCLAPTRELAVQIKGEVERMGEFTPVTSVLFVPPDEEDKRAGRGWKEEIARTGPPHIAVGTPGTVANALSNKNVTLEQLRIFVLDEADAMLDTGGQLAAHTVTVKNFAFRTGATRNLQMVLFSATFPDHVTKFVSKFCPNANEIRLQSSELAHQNNIKQFFMDCKNTEQKYEVLVELYSLLTIGQSVIFVKHRDDADKIAARMTAEGHKVASLHGGLTPNQRDALMKSFREGTSKVLLATDVLARGIDVVAVSMVVNYDLPEKAGHAMTETYLHRIGRTGRFGRQGIAISFIHDRRSGQEFETINRAVKGVIKKVSTDDFEVMEKVVRAALKEK